MLIDILPTEIKEGILKLDYDKLFEIRLRVNMPVTVNVSGKYYYLGEKGLCFVIGEALVATKEMVENFVFRASENSIYAVNTQIQNGFLTIKGGVRIGISGNMVIENEKVVTINNFSSVNIRIPHEVKNCSLSSIKYLIDDKGFKNTLIISPPGAGKTTFLRDVACQLSNLNIAYNLLVLDERFEIASNVNGEMLLNVGKFTDVLSGADKRNGFEIGIRSLKPDIIFTDELAGREDASAIFYASNCGVKVVATIHAASINEFKKKPDFEALVKNQIFERYIVLSSANGPGTYEGIYDEKFNCLYCR